MLLSLLSFVVYFVRLRQVLRVCVKFYVFASIFLRLHQIFPRLRQIFTR